MRRQPTSRRPEAVNIRLHEIVREHANTISWLHGEIAQRDRTVAWLHAEVAERDRVVDSLRGGRTARRENRLVRWARRVWERG